LDKVSKYQLFDSNYNKLRETKYYYDNKLSGLTKGDLTKKADYLDDETGNPVTYYNYDEFGNPYRQTDPLGKTIVYYYGSKDSTHTFPDRVNELGQADEILERCPVDKEFFEGKEFPDYFSSEFLAGWWETYYRDHFNITGMLDIGVEAPKSQDKIYLKEINVTYTNDNDINFYNVGMKVTVKVDNEKHESTYYENDGIVYKLKPGWNISRTLRKKDISFTNNITVTSKLYRNLEDIDIAPITRTFKREDFVQ
jgi:YD repeat-containing protein